VSAAADMSPTIRPSGSIPRYVFISNYFYLLEPVSA